MATRRALDRIGETILREPQVRRAVVATVEARKLARELPIVDAGDLADVRVELYRLEAAGSEPALRCEQGLACGRESLPDAARHGVGGEKNRSHWSAAL